jgi:hypothetical protein
MGNEEKPILVPKAKNPTRDFGVGTFIEEQMKDDGFEGAVNAARDRFPVRGRRAARSTITDAYRRYRQRKRLLGYPGY